jgi:hypothetical protein
MPARRLNQLERRDLGPWPINHELIQAIDGALSRSDLGNVEIMAGEESSPMTVAVGAARSTIVVLEPVPQRASRMRRSGRSLSCRARRSPQMRWECAWWSYASGVQSGSVTHDPAPSLRPSPLGGVTELPSRTPPATAKQRTPGCGRSACWYVVCRPARNHLDLAARASSRLARHPARSRAYQVVASVR